MQENVNIRIELRETSRPFEPPMLEERTAKSLACSNPEESMLRANPTRLEQQAFLQAVTHADGTGRLQCVSPGGDAHHDEPISKFEQLTDVPMLLNTSLNENEPIVESPDQAIDCFLPTKMDRLIARRIVLSCGCRA